jgi:hypothetical protein
MTSGTSHGHDGLRRFCSMRMMDVDSVMCVGLSLVGEIISKVSFDCRKVSFHNERVFRYNLLLGLHSSF